MSEAKVYVSACGFAQPSLGATPSAFFEAMLSLRRCVNTAAWKPSDHARSPQIRRMSRVSSMAFVSAMSAAAEDGGFTGDSSGEDVSAVFASTHGSTRFLVDFHEGFFRDPSTGASPMVFTNGVSNAPVAHLSLELGIRGRCHTIVSGALGAIEGLSLALRFASSGCSAALLAAGEEFCPIMEHGYRAYTALGRPARCKTLPDASNLCEGAVAFVLRPGTSGVTIAAPRFAPAGHDPSDVSGPVEEAVLACLDSIGMRPDDLGFLVLSRKGGQQDDSEADGIARAFKGRSRPLPVCAPSALMGEGFTFTALAQVLAGVLALRRGELPPFAASREGLAAPFMLPETPCAPAGRAGIVVCRDTDGSAAAVALSAAESTRAGERHT